MGNGFNDVDRLTSVNVGSAQVVLEKPSGTTNAQRKKAELALIRNDVGVLIATDEDGFQKPKPIKKRRAKALDEDVFVSTIEKIIRRDFFPELSKLEAQHAYLTAMENNDMDALKNIAIRYQTPLRQGFARTPGGFETPSVRGTPATDLQGTPAPFTTPRMNTDGTKSDAPLQEDEIEKQSSKLAKNASLDGFLNKYTSEDNEAYEEISDLQQERLKKKYKWLYEKVEQQKKQLSITAESNEQKMLQQDAGMHMPIEGWHYTPRNSLMYPPKSQEVTVTEKVNRAAKPRAISHNSTRFANAPYPTTLKAGSTSGTFSSVMENLKAGKPDESDSPKVNGYGFVVTPSPMPAPEDDPTMTWGFIDGTPFRLDAGDTPQNETGQVFTMPEQSERELLAEKMNAEHARKKRKNSLSRKQKERPKTGSALARLSTPNRLATMSPGAQKLGKSLLRGHGSVLRAAYNGTPQSRPATRTPRATPMTTPRMRTPLMKSSSSTPSHVSSQAKSAISDTGSITDNLL
eukprot:m.78103 g.78103  ORF g.78103 m.78103 type:complete len:517 (-) comp12657_c0_seq1:196-1746(-)